MAVRHGVTDSDNHFIIDPVTRTIKNQSGKLTLIQHDHNSERFTFECPRYVDEHDMSLCDKIEIHYINTGTGSYQSSGIYETDDLEASADGTDVVTFSWLISRNATQHVGKLNFVIRFMCLGSESELEYAWNTAIYSDIVIAKSIYNGEEFVEEYIDVLEQWKQDLYAEGLKISSIEQTTTSTEDGGTNVITATMTDGSTETFEIRNGSKGEQGASITGIEHLIHLGEHVPGEFDHYEILFSDGRVVPIQIYNGADGTFIEDIVLINGGHVPGTFDDYAIRMSDGTEKPIQIYNGADGAHILSIERVTADDTSGGNNIYEVKMSDDSILTFDVYNGIDGVSITGVHKVSGDGSPGSTDTYRIIMSDGNSSIFTVYNGKDGTSGDGSGDMTAAVYDPQDKKTDIFKYVDDAVGESYPGILTVEATTSEGVTTTDHSASEIISHVRDGGTVLLNHIDNGSFVVSGIYGAVVYFQNMLGQQTTVCKVLGNTATFTSTTASNPEPMVVEFTDTTTDGVTSLTSNYTHTEIIVAMQEGRQIIVSYADAEIKPTVFATSEYVMLAFTMTDFDITFGAITFLIQDDAVTLKESTIAFVPSDSVTTDSSDTVATSKAVKIAYDKAVEAANAAADGGKLLLVTATTGTDSYITTDYTAAEVITHLRDGGNSRLLIDGTKDAQCLYSNASTVWYGGVYSDLLDNVTIVTYMLTGSSVTLLTQTLDTSSSGGTVTSEDIQEAVNNYLTENPVEAADNNFYAVYGETTNAEIEEAYAAGKNIYCLMSDGGVCPLYARYSANNHCFYKGASYFYCMSTGWTEPSIPYEGTTNKVTSITADSTDTKYPSAKAVYDLVISSITGAIEGSY